jgi:hypothetical protein
MDLLDLLKLMFRRWYVTLPVILAALGAAVAVGLSIQPEYKTSAAVLLVPPSSSAPATGPGATPAPGNPWLKVGENAMAQAVQISISSYDARTKVEAAGGESTYEAGLVNRSSIITVDVTATTRDRALATVEAATRLIKDEVAAKQAGYKPRPGEQITTEVLDPGLNITESRSNVLRAQIVVLAIGVLLAAAAAVAADAISRRRGAARLGGAGRGATGTGHSGQARVDQRLSGLVVSGAPLAGSPNPDVTEPLTVPGGSPIVPTYRSAESPAPRDGNRSGDQTVLISAIRDPGDEQRPETPAAR